MRSSQSVFLKLSRQSPRLFVQARTLARCSREEEGVSLRKLLILQSARRDSNPRPSPWQGDTPPLSHSRICCWLFASNNMYNTGCSAGLSTTFLIFLIILFFAIIYTITESVKPYPPSMYCRFRCLYGFKIALRIYSVLGKLFWLILSRRIRSTSSHNSSATVIILANIIPKFTSSRRLNFSEIFFTEKM